MGVFTRIFKVAQASAHAGIEALDDPIKITEQGIRDMKNLQGAMSSLAQVKALAVVPGPLPVAVALALQALRARSRVASSMRKINRQLASGADASGTVAMLEKMKHKVQEENRWPKPTIPSSTSAGRSTTTSTGRWLHLRQAPEPMRWRS